jgi:hypothetical protein
MGMGVDPMGMGVDPIAMGAKANPTVGGMRGELLGFTNHQKSNPMQCLNCMSKDAHREKISGWQWISAPLAVPVMCNRCLTSYYYPWLLVWLDGLQKRVTHP